MPRRAVSIAKTKIYHANLIDAIEIDDVILTALGGIGLLACFAFLQDHGVLRHGKRIAPDCR